MPVVREYTPPRFGAQSFNCPHCGAAAHQDWEELHTVQSTASRRDSSGNVVRVSTGEASVSTSRCFSCKAKALWVVPSVMKTYSSTRHPIRATGGMMVWPVLSEPKPANPPADLPPSVADVYREAQDVASASPRAAAALLRLALEGTLRELYPDEKTLNGMIGAAARDGLAPTVIQAMDVLRFNGNTAAHELHLDDGRPQVDSLFDVLHLIVTRLITEPAQIAAMREALPPSVDAAIARRDGVPPPPSDG